MVFGFLPLAECSETIFFFKARPKLKVFGGCFWVLIYAYNVFFENRNCPFCLISQPILTNGFDIKGQNDKIYKIGCAKNQHRLSPEKLSK
jgi:hypothetical protein